MKHAIEEARRTLGQAGRIVSFSGAGLSAESGVPTFRSASGTGLWSKYDPMTLASPQGFARDPNLVIEWYAWRRRLIAEAQPNAAHVALANRKDIVHITQNVDDLLHRAGATHVIQLHGTIARDRCHGDGGAGGCGFEEPIDLANPPPLRGCACGSAMRPSIVWFGEALPGAAWAHAERACLECDALLVIGTSAAVYPAAGLIHLARSRGAAIIVVNSETCNASPLADVELLGRAGELLPQLLAAEADHLPSGPASGL